MGKRIEETPHQRLLAQMDFARKADVSLITVTRLENDASANPRVSTIRKITEAVDGEPARLMFGVEEKAAA